MRYIIAFFFSTFCCLPLHGTLSDRERYEEGAVCLEEIKNSKPNWIDRIRTIEEEPNCSLCDYEKVGRISPSTLRAVKMFCDLQEEFGEKLPHLHVVEVYCDTPKLEKTIHRFIDVASFKSISFDQYSPGVEDVVISNDEIPNLKIIASSVPYGIINGATKAVDTSVNHAIKQVVASEKKGKCTFYRINETLEHYKLTWKPSPEQQPSSLHAPFPYLPGLKLRNHIFISYRLSGGRLGDNLLAYSRAKWAAMKYGFPLIVKPFNKFENFQLSKLDYPYSLKSKLKRKQEFKHLSLIPKAKQNTVITIPYFPEYPWTKSSAHNEFSHFKVQWDDPKFKKELKRCLSPTQAMDLIPLPKDKLSIAMHVRRGGLVESFEELNINYPLKAPKNEYYIRQLKRICALFADRPIYVYLFSDSHEPDVLCTLFEKALDNPNVTFDWSKDNSSVLKDFISIGEFDCLIRSASNFSVMAGKRGDYIFETSPIKGRVEGNKSVVIKYELIF